MTQTLTSPQITHFKWGHLDVEGHPRPLKDGKFYPGGCHEWDWNETGTRHKPGIQPADVQELIDNGAQVIILSKGVEEQLHTMQSTFDLLTELGIEVHHLQTEHAIEKYNELAAAGQPVGALIHSTC